MIVTVALPLTPSTVAVIVAAPTVTAVTAPLGGAVDDCLGNRMHPERRQPRPAVLARAGGVGGERIDEPRAESRAEPESPTEPA